jgi:phosphohistidine phosphatase SixA
VTTGPCGGRVHSRSPVPPTGSVTRPAERSPASRRRDAEGSTRTAEPASIALSLVAPLLATLLIVALATAQVPRPGPALAVALRRGGYVIFVRHGAADEGARPGAVAALPSDLRDCHGATRPLTDSGLAQARTIGEALRTLGIPVGSIITSPACRAIETAWYALARRPRLEDDLFRAGGGGATLRRLLGTRPGPGTNTVIVGHVSNILAATNVSIEQGEALVVEPAIDGTFRIVARVEPDGWMTLDH